MERTELVNNAVKALESMALADSNQTSLMLGNQVFESEDDNECPEGCNYLDYFLNGELGSNSSINFKKTLASALKIAKSTGVVELDASSPSEIVAIATQAAEHLRASYKVSQGEWDVYEAGDKLIDAVCARGVAFVQMGGDMAIDTVVNYGSAAILAVCPEAGPVITIARPLIQRAKPMIKNCIIKGVRAIGEVAKKAVRTLGEKAKEYLKHTNQVIA